MLFVSTQTINIEILSVMTSKLSAITILSPKSKTYNMHQDPTMHVTFYGPELHRLPDPT